MIKHGKILVPTDFTEQSTEALRRAVVLAECFDAEVHLLHILEPIFMYDPELVSFSPVREITEVMRRGAKKRLERQARHPHFKVHTHLQESMVQPARAICEFAEALPADLIIIGRHGHHSLLEHLLIGSTAERVVRYAPCTVIVTIPHG
jgi:nucleotide-binding universal stress UspA family protein